MPKVSIIMPAYNAERFIEESIRSAFKQNLTDFEMIVVDDGSVDRTRQIIEKFANRVNYIYQENQGVGIARNTGIQHAQGEYVTFLDSDDIWSPSKLERQIKILESNPEIDIIGCNAEIINEKGESLNTVYTNGKKHDIKPNEMFTQLLLKNFIPISSVVVRKSAMHDLGGFDGSLLGCEDYEFLLRASQKHNIIFLNEVLMKYRKSPHNMSQNLEVQHRYTIITMQSFVYGKKIDMRLCQRFSNIFYGLGYALFEKDQFREARGPLLNSIRYWPFSNFKKYFLILSTLLPADFIIWLRNLKRKIVWQ